MGNSLRLGASQTKVDESSEEARAECDAYKKSALQNRVVIFVAQSLNRAGCIASDSLVECAQCTPGTSGGFEAPSVPGELPRVILCCGRIKSQEHAAQVVTHELIHAFDYCRARMSADNLVHHACTEIRAANLSGDCDFTVELARGRFGFRKHKQACIRRRAIASLLVNPACKSREDAEKAVSEAWSTCLYDTAPFERAL